MQQETSPITTRMAGSVGPAAAALLVYPGLKYGVGLHGDGFFVSALAMLAAYALAVYLVFAVAQQALAGRWVMLLIAWLAGVALGLALCPKGFRYMMVFEPLALGGAAWIAGRRARVETSQLRLYLVGLVVVAAVAIVQNAPSWPQLLQAFRYFGEELVAHMRTSLESLGYAEATAARLATTMGSVMDGVARVAPAATVFNLVAQFSIGFVVFLAWGARNAPCGKLVPFRNWKIPMIVTPVVAVVIVVRLLFSDPVAQVADNLLLVASIYYCVGGLALIEYTMAQAKLPGWARIVALAVLGILGLIGYVITVLLGLIDSLAGRRKNGPGELQLNEV